MVPGLQGIPYGFRAHGTGGKVGYDCCQLVVGELQGLSLLFCCAFRKALPDPFLGALVPGNAISLFDLAKDIDGGP